MMSDWTGSKLLGALELLVVAWVVCGTGGCCCCDESETIDDIEADEADCLPNELLGLLWTFAVKSNL